MSADLNTLKTASRTLLTAALQQKTDHIHVFDQVLSMGIINLALEKMKVVDGTNFKYFALVGSSYTDLASDDDFLELTALSDKQNADAGIMGITETKGVDIPIVSDIRWSDEETVLPPNCLYLMAMSDTSVVGSVCVHLTPITWHQPSTGIN